jgi:hypothetical protein
VVVCHAPVAALVFAAGIGEYPRGAPPYGSVSLRRTITRRSLEQALALDGVGSEMTRENDRRRFAGCLSSIRWAA